MNYEQETLQSGLENAAGNLTTDAYWRNLPEFAGEEYGKIASNNKHQVEQLHAGMTGEKPLVRGNHTYSGAEAAEDWYLKLGTHNSLYGLRDDLVLAARLVYFNSDREYAPSASELRIALAGEKQPTVKPQEELLACQMLLDSTKDPSPSKPGKDQAAEDRITLQVVKKSTDRIMREQLPKSGDSLDSENQRLLSDAIKFNFESRFQLLAREPEANWKSRWDVLAQRAHDERTKRLAAGSKNKGPNELALERASDPDELKKMAFLQEALHQAAELDKHAKYLTNGELTEHYFNLLLRHTVLSKDEFATVSSTTVRQDQPHDGIYRDSSTGRLSHDAVVEDATTGKTLYIQLKAGKEDEGYHPEIVVLNPFEAQDNKTVRQEALRGLRELRGALAELVTGQFYEGSVSTLELHEGKIKTALQQRTQVLA
jgi:hypothetical protein